MKILKFLLFLVSVSLILSQETFGDQDFFDEGGDKFAFGERKGFNSFIPKKKSVSAPKRAYAKKRTPSVKKSSYSNNVETYESKPKRNSKKFVKNTSYTSPKSSRNAYDGEREENDDQGDESYDGDNELGIPDFSGNDDEVRRRFGIPSDAEMAEMKRKQDEENRKKKEQEEKLKISKSGSSHGSNNGSTKVQQEKKSQPVKIQSKGSSK